ncbi:MAG: GNAT family acetyltransferase [Gammaproteobacteria bacterium]|nr:GNAT family acetyltransferase [Gammaproteobacteria bacterium]
MSNLDIQPFQQPQLKQVIELWRRCELIMPWNDPVYDIQFSLSSTDSELLVLTREEKVIGTVMVGHDGHRGWIYYLAVSPVFQRSGYGRFLMVTAENWLKDRDVPKLNLMIRGGNKKALSFYKRLGFEDDNVVVMGKRYFDPRVL